MGAPFVRRIGAGWPDPAGCRGHAWSTARRSAGDRRRRRRGRRGGLGRHRAGRSLHLAWNRDATHRRDRQICECAGEAVHSFAHALPNLSNWAFYCALRAKREGEVQASSRRPRYGWSEHARCLERQNCELMPRAACRRRPIHAGLGCRSRCPGPGARLLRRFARHDAGWSNAWGERALRQTGASPSTGPLTSR